MSNKKDRKLTHINDLFSKYRTTLKAPQGAVVGAFIEVVDDLLQVPIDKKAVSYSVHTKILSLRVPGPLKSEILLKKNEILTHLRGRLGAQSAPKNIV